MKRIVIFSLLTALLVLAGCSQMMQNIARTIDSWVSDNPTAVRYTVEHEPVDLLDLDADSVADASDECPDTPADAMVDAMGCPVSLYVAVRVHYDGLESTPAPGQGRMIDRVGRLLAENPAATLQLQGHTDDVGGASDKQALSEARAEVIRKVIVERYGIDESRISVAGYGASRPLVSNESEAGRARNRRVEMKVNGYYAARIVYVAMDEPAVLHFALGESSLQVADSQRMEELAAAIIATPDARAVIEGHTDAIGNSDKNMLLSQQRAESVLQVLQRKYGVPAERLEARGFGDTRPVAENDTEKGRFLNRRVTITIKMPERAPRRAGLDIASDV